MGPKHRAMPGLESNTRWDSVPSEAENRALTASEGEKGTVRSVVLCRREQAGGRGGERRELAELHVCQVGAHPPQPAG